MEVLLKNIKKSKYKGDLKTYINNGGYKALKKVLKLSPDVILDEIETSQLLGRGGAAFPADMKWKFAHKANDYPKYVVCNADEGEPGTFKDKLILENDPHLLIEGMIICGYTVNANEGFIYLRGEYYNPYSIVQNALKEAEENNLLGNHILGTDFSFKIKIYRGAGAYICGEETALLDSLAGRKGQSRVKPPFPTFVGYKNQPTVLNNVETLANIPQIVLRGGEWFSKIGSPRTTGTKLYCLSGDVNKPGVYELPTTTTLRKLIKKYGEGEKGKIKAVLIGGVSGGFLTPDKLNSKLDYPSVQEAGSMLGSGAVIVINNRHCMVDLAKKCVEFFSYESCGKCTPCREGTKRALEILTNMTQGQGEESDIPLLKELQEVMYDTSRCGLGQAALNAVISVIENFPDEVEDHIKRKKCALGICKM